MTAQGAYIRCRHGYVVGQLPLHTEVELVDRRIFDIRVNGFNALARVELRSGRRIGIWEDSSAGSGAGEVVSGATVQICEGWSVAKVVANGERHGVLHSQEHTSELQSLRHLVCR